jgi:hypothetical protein
MNEDMEDSNTTSMYCSMGNKQGMLDSKHSRTLSLGNNNTRCTGISAE